MRAAQTVVARAAGLPLGPGDLDVAPVAAARAAGREARPTRLAQAIRGLAHDAHWTLTHSPSPAALRELSRRIEVLRSALGDRRSGSLGTWLVNLGREVRLAAADRAASSRRMCLCA